MNRLDFAVVTSLNRTIIGKYQTNDIAVRRTCLKTRPVGAPGLQDRWIRVGICGPRALTRCFRRVFKQAPRLILAWGGLVMLGRRHPTRDHSPVIVLRIWHRQNAFHHE